MLYKSPEGFYDHKLSVLKIVTFCQMNISHDISSMLLPRGIFLSKTYFSVKMKFRKIFTVSTAAVGCLYLVYTKSKRSKREIVDGVEILNEIDMIEIEKRFDKRRNRLRTKCENNGYSVPDFDDIDQTLVWPVNQILHDIRKGT